MIAAGILVVLVGLLAALVVLAGYCHALLAELRRARREAKTRGERNLQLGAEQVRQLLNQQRIELVQEEELRRIRKADEASAG